MTHAGKRRLNTLIVSAGWALILLGLAATVRAAFAQAPPPPPTPPLLVDVPGAPSDPWALVQALVSDAEAGHWRLALGLAMVGIVMAARFGVARIPRFGAWVKTDRGGAAFTVLFVEAAAFAAVLLSPVKITWAVGLKVAVNALAGSAGVAGLYVLLKRLLWPADRVMSPRSPLVTIAPAPAADSPRVA